MKKLKKILLILLLVLVCLAAAVLLTIKLAGSHRSDPKDIVAYETTNPFITGRTELITHRCGAGIAPEESLMAMKECLTNPNIAMDIYEFDLRLTKDEQLVLFHNRTLDETTDAAEVFGETGLFVQDKTLAELKQLNIGAKFIDENGTQPYAELSSVPEELRILTLSEALDYLTDAGVTRFSIEAKDAGEAGMKAVDLLYAELSSRNLLETTIFSSFKTDVSAYAQETYPDLIRSNTDAQAIEFFLAAITGNKNYEPPCSVFQLPFNDKYLNMGINFATAQVINYAHNRNIALHYWVVDEPEGMQYLESLGVDGIMTDYPDVLTETLK